MTEERVLVIANSFHGYKRWLADNRLLGEQNKYIYMDSLSRLHGYWDNKVIYVGTPINSPVWGSPRLKAIERRYHFKCRLPLEDSFTQ